MKGGKLFDKKDKKTELHITKKYRMRVLTETIEKPLINPLIERLASHKKELSNFTKAKIEEFIRNGEQHT